MTMSLVEYATTKVDWDVDFIWVQNTSLLKIISRNDDSVEVMRHDGVTLLLDQDTAQSDYFEIRDGAYLKPVYAPCMAHILPSGQRLDAGDGVQDLPEGSAILRRETGYAALHQTDLMRDYEAVSERSDPRFPETPFSR